MSFEEQGFFDKVYHRNGKLYKKVNKESIDEMINAVNSKSFSNKDLLIVDITDEKIRSYSKTSKYFIVTSKGVFYIF